MQLMKLKLRAVLNIKGTVSNEISIPNWLNYRPWCKRIFGESRWRRDTRNAIHNPIFIKQGSAMPQKNFLSPPVQAAANARSKQHIEKACIELIKAMQFHCEGNELQRIFNRLQTIKSSYQTQSN